MKRLVALGAAALLALAGCAAPATTPSTSGNSVTGEITVFAAASLKESFTKIAQEFETANPGTKVTLSFGPSSGLATQINSGAPVDVFASAAVKNMDSVVQAGKAANPEVFARNVLEIATPPANPANITQFSDLAKSGVKLAICQAQVPCGVVTAKVAEKAGVKLNPVSLEVDVKSVLTKVTLGEVDAGLVYRTDVKAAGDKVHGIEIPADINSPTDYPIAPIRDSKNAATADAFVKFVLSEKGAQIIADAGFTKP